jgi:hypothetical protein
MTLFGLSPLFLCLLASRYFTDSSTGLNVTHFLTFLALASGITHLVGAFTLRITKSQCNTASISDDSASCDDESSIDERRPLLRNKAPVSSMQAIPSDEGTSVMYLLRDPHFWLLAFVMLIILGSVSYLVATNLCANFKQ